MWKGPAVNSPMRLAWSRGNVSQSPTCFPTWEQLQPPSASSSWWLPEGSALHPSISGERLLCCDRQEFQGLMKSVGLLSWLSVNMHACLFWWSAHWHRKKNKKNMDTQQSAHFSLHSREDLNQAMVLIGLSRAHITVKSFQLMVHVNTFFRFLQAFSNSLCWSTDAVNRMSCLQSKHHSAV